MDGRAVSIRYLEMVSAFRRASRRSPGCDLTARRMTAQRYLFELLYSLFLYPARSCAAEHTRETPRYLVFVNARSVCCSRVSLPALDHTIGASLAEGPLSHKHASESRNKALRGSGLHSASLLPIFQKYCPAPK